MILGLLRRIHLTDNNLIGLPILLLHVGGLLLSTVSYSAVTFSAFNPSRNLISLLCLQKSASGLCPKPVELSPHLHSLLL